MKLSNPTLLTLFLLLVIIWSSCSSGKSAYEHGNYYDAVITSVNRLRRNTDNKKSSETLRAAYPMAVRFYEDKANAAVNSNVEFKWREVVQHYSTLQAMHDEIQRAPGALRVIPNPNNYQSKLADARQKAAEESYNAGIMAMGAGGRDNAKRAYYLFIKANEYASGYRDVKQKIEEARWAATVKIAVDPIPVVAKNYALDAHYFDSKLNEYLQVNQISEFVKFYKSEDVKAQNIIPDHIVQLSFEEFAIGQLYVNEKESQVEKDSIVVAYTFTDTKGALLRQQTEAPKILPAVTVGTVTGVNVNTTSKVEEKKNNETQTTTSTQSTSTPQTTTTTETSPADNKSTTTNTTSSTSTTQSTSQNTTTTSDQGKTDVKSDDKKGESTNENNTGGNKIEEQVTICHQPPGKPAERKSITIPQSAVKAHMAHGDVLGECSSEKKDDKSKDNQGKNGGAGMADLRPINNNTPILIASVSNSNLWYLFEKQNELADTTKIYGKVKATVHHFKKTITSHGVLNFRIIDARTNAVISEERMPSESVWLSEWLTYNGDSRALSAEQSRLATQKELPQPNNQDLFAEFTSPLFDQIKDKITAFYRNY